MIAPDRGLLLVAITACALDGFAYLVVILTHYVAYENSEPVWIDACGTNAGSPQLSLLS